MLDTDRTITVRMLDTLPHDHEADRPRSSVRTPPDGVDAVPSSRSRRGSTSRREVLIDSGCEALYQAHLGHRAAPFRLVKMDVSRALVAGDGAQLSRSPAVLFALHTSKGLSTLDVIRQFRAREPHVGVYLLVERLREVAHLLPYLAEAGVDEVFCLESRSDLASLFRTLTARTAAPAPEAELRLLWKWFRDSSERALVMHCIRNGFRLDDWAVRGRMFNACRKTIQNRMTTEGLPSPGMVARCGRVLHLQELERRGVRPTSLIAQLLDFPSPSAMQRTRRRLRKALMSRGRQSLVFASLIR